MHGHWSSGVVFVLAATGSAVGLGNLWRFPYLVGESGGGAFVLIYLLCILLVGTPIMIAEVMLGRRGRRSPINSLRVIAREEGLSPNWQLLGWMGVVAGFMILSFYSVVGGWTLFYSVEALQGAFSGISGNQAGQVFAGLVDSAWLVVGWHTAFILILFVIVAAGVRKGLQRAVTILMPMLFALLVLLVLHGMTTGGFAATVQFMFKPDFSVVDATTVLTALGQAFFTLSLGMGAIMVYGAYLPSSTSIPGTTAWIVGMDTLTAIIAGLAIFPIVFAANMEPAQGTSLVFITLPVVFGEIPFGFVLGVMFFALLTLAAVTSGISLLEPAVAYITEVSRLRRAWAAAAVTAAIWLMGVAAGLSLNIWSDVRLLPFMDQGIFDMLEFISSNILLPLGGLLTAVFVAWCMTRKTVLSELDLHSHGQTYKIWLFATRYIAPTAVILVFLHSIGLF